jgi:hypothetical protein
VWQAIVAERIRRNSVNTLVLYTHQRPHNDEDTKHEIKRAAPTSSLIKKSQIMATPLTVPRLNRPISPTQNGVLKAPSLSIVLRHSESGSHPPPPASTSEEEEPPPKMMKWPGLEEVMEAFQRYHQGILHNL